MNSSNVCSSGKRIFSAPESWNSSFRTPGEMSKWQEVVRTWCLRNRVIIDGARWLKHQGYMQHRHGYLKIPQKVICHRRSEHGVGKKHDFIAAMLCLIRSKQGFRSFFTANLREKIKILARTSRFITRNMLRIHASAVFAVLALI